VVNIKIKLLKSLIGVLIIFTVIGSYYYLSKIKPYNQLMTSANKSMDKEDYGKAETLYEDALSLKKDSSLNKKIELAKLLNKSKGIYESAIKQIDNKEYLVAIDSFKKVDNKDTKRYTISKSKISECTKLYISDNLESAKENLANGKFVEANKYLTNILKLDVNNKDVKVVQKAIIEAIQRQKDEVAMVAALAKVKAADEAKAKAAKVTPKIITLIEAENILNTNKYVISILGTDSKTKYWVASDSNYVSAEVRNNYYIFSYGSDEWEADSNICVDKKTGKLYMAIPSDTGSTIMTIEDFASRIPI